MPCLVEQYIRTAVRAMVLTSSRREKYGPSLINTSFRDALQSRPPALRSSKILVPILFQGEFHYNYTNNSVIGYLVYPLMTSFMEIFTRRSVY